MFNVDPLYPLPPKYLAKSTLLANAIEMSLREEMEGNIIVSLAGNEAKPEAPQEATHVVNMC